MAVLKYFIERRFIKVVFSKVKNATGGISTSCKLTVPKKWMDSMGLSPDDRQVCVDFDPEKKSIVIRKAEDQDIILLSKDLLKEIGANSNSNFSVFVNKEDEIISLLKL